MLVSLRSLAVVGLIAAAACNAQHTDTLRVLSYNIHHGEGMDGKLDLPRIARVIQSASPDIVALQEVDQNAERSGAIDQPAELARLTEMQVVFGGNIPLQGGHYGNAILAKLPIITHQNILLPSHDDREQRGVIVAQLRFGRGVLRMMATHFDHRRDDAERLEAARRINQLAWGQPSAPSILAGDINATRNSNVLKRLEQAWSIAGDSEQPTIPVAVPDRQIDFVFMAPKNAWQVMETRVLNESIASDHRPILAVLRLREDGGEHPSEQVVYQDVREVLDDQGRITVAGSPEQWKSRGQTIRRAMQSIMGFLPQLTDRQPPDITVIEEVDCGDYIRQKITYLSQPGCDTPAYLCIPKHISAGARVPAVLCLHPTDDVIGHGVVVGLGGRANRQYASELAERGYVTLAPSYPLLADYQPDLKELGWESGTLKAVWDNMRGIDLLQSLPYVDRDSIGAIGHSLGGHNSIYTAVFDERIKVVVSSCGFDSYADYYDGDPKVWEPGKGWTQLRYIPRLADYRGRLDQIPFDFDEMLAALAPRNVLVVAPLHDSNFRAASVDRVTAAARKVYSLYGQAERLQVLHPDCEHDFPDPMRLAAFDLFNRVLKSRHDAQ